MNTYNEHRIYDEMNYLDMFIAKYGRCRGKQEFAQFVKLFSE